MTLSSDTHEHVHGDRAATGSDPTGGPQPAGGPCPACGAEPATGPDRVEHRERALWDALDRAEAVESGPVRSLGRPSEMVRARDEAEEAAAAGEAARLALAGHLDHLLAAYAQSASPPFWFVHGFGLPTGRQAIADWATRSGAMLGYRRRYGITDPLRPLGEQPPAGSALAPRWAELMRFSPPTR